VATESSTSSQFSNIKDETFDDQTYCGFLCIFFYWLSFSFKALIFLAILGPCIGVLSVGFSVVGLFTMAVMLPASLQRIQRTSEFVTLQANTFKVSYSRLNN
jgi:hypothetical protein